MRDAACQNQSFCIGGLLPSLANYSLSFAFIINVFISCEHKETAAATNAVANRSGNERFDRKTVDASIFADRAEAVIRGLWGKSKDDLGPCSSRSSDAKGPPAASSVFDDERRSAAVFQARLFEPGKDFLCFLFGPSQQSR